MEVIDTCSLLALVRYYLPMDRDSIIFNFIKSKIESKELIVIDKVYDQCKYVSAGMVVKTLTYLKQNAQDTTECLPNKSFFNDVDNRFINGTVKNQWTAEQFEVKKREFLEDADAKLLLFCLNNNNMLSKPRIVTEETEGSNDNKGFKKVPALCKILGIETVTLPDLLKEWGVFDLLINTEPIEANENEDTTDDEG